MFKKLLPVFLVFIFYSTIIVAQSNVYSDRNNYPNTLSLKNIEKSNISLKLKSSGNENYIAAADSPLKLKNNIYSLAGNYNSDNLSKFKLKESSAKSNKRYIDIYFHNFYDTYQENYIANFVGHIHFGIGPNFFVGPYLDVYADSRSTKNFIYNDRFVEIGFFARYFIMKNLFFEGRIGYTRQIDLDSNKINFKPMLIYFNRFGEAKLKVDKSSPSKTSLYIDIYYAAMYDYKYKNAFLQGMLQQVIRFHTKGYSYIENYLFESGQFDGRKLDYNNYFEIGTGLRFKPNVLIGPVIFVEPTYKVYFFGDKKNSFQVKAGFLLNFFLDI